MLAKSDVSVEEAVALVKGNATAKFDETIEIAVSTSVLTPRHADQMVRGVVGLPNGTGKSMYALQFLRVAPRLKKLKAAGADIDRRRRPDGNHPGRQPSTFDRCIATPDMMPIVGRLGKILGPRNLMPNPKVGTVTMDVKTAVEAAKGGEVQFKV